MIVLETIAVALSMYSALPMPQFSWNERNMKYAMCAFPLVGLLIAAAEWLAFRLCVCLGIFELLRGAILCLLPVIITGGIHLDGYCDTADALSSHATPEKKQEILKDPHIGAFAAIRLAVYLLMSFALWATLPEKCFLPALFGFGMSRCLSGISVCCFPLAKKTGLAHSFAAAAERKRTACVLSVLLALLSVGALALDLFFGTAAILAALLCFRHYYRTALREFGGLSGDLAGWFLQKCEFWILASVYVCSLWRQIL